MKKSIKWSVYALISVVIFHGATPLMAAEKDDVFLIKELNKRLEGIENTVLSDSKKLDNLMLNASASKDRSPETANKRGKLLTKLATNITNTLSLSMNINTPDIQNETAKTHIAEAIDAHKHWALAQQGKMSSLLQLNSADMQKFASESDHYAEIEAYSLALADKVIEHKSLK